MEPEVPIEFEFLELGGVLLLVMYAINFYR